MTALKEVYQSSFEWAQLGAETVSVDTGVATLNENEPGYREGNSVWKLRIGESGSDTIAAIDSLYASRGLKCHHWIPDLNSPETDTVLTSLGFSDSPSYALVRKPQPHDLPDEYRFISAKDDPVCHASVYELAGQRWRYSNLESAMARLTSNDNYTPFTCLRHGSPVGRIGALLTSTGNMRVKSIFVGSEFRKQGVASIMLGFVSNLASQHGCDVVCSEVECDNLPSVQLHHKNGFRQLDDLLHCYSRIAP